jgi:hypothetical protein
MKSAQGAIKPAVPHPSHTTVLSIVVFSFPQSPSVLHRSVCISPKSKLSSCLSLVLITIMKLSTLALLAVGVLAQRPENTSICDYYTTALLKDNTAKNQATVLTALVNTVVLGSKMPKPNITGVTFPMVDGLNGILDPMATFMGQGANLLPYFDGGLASSNRGGSSGVAVNFLDDGGAAPLTMFMPATGTSSNQYKLLTHLYQFFGTLLKCSQQGSGADFPSYEGEASMYKVHKFMALNSSQVGYFIQQVGLAAKSFGVADADVTAVGDALTSLFDVRCGAATAAVPAQGPQLQSICITSDCKEAANASCDSYAAAVDPGVANSTLAMGEGNSSSAATSSASGSMATGGSGSSPSGTSPSTPAVSQGAAPMNVAGVLAAGGAAAFAFFL